MQVIFAQPRNIPLYCAQILEQRIEERTRAGGGEEEEENKNRNNDMEERRNMKQEKEKKGLEMEKKDHKVKLVEPKSKRNCESQTGFTTDSGIDRKLKSKYVRKVYKISQNKTSKVGKKSREY